MKKNTENMEAQYQGLLQNIIKAGSLDDPATGKPFLPSKEVLRSIQSTFNELQTQLADEKKDNQDILDAAEKAVNDCNADRASAFSSSVVPKKNAMTAARGTHSTCRGTEDTQIADMETKCQTFQDKKAKCSEKQDWYVQYNEAADLGADETNDLKDVVDAAVECKASVGTLSGTAVDCDGKQTAFVSSYCTFEGALASTCATHKKCYDDETRDYGITKGSVENLEVEQKTILKMVKKVDCYFNKLLGAQLGNMPKQSDIDECMQSSPTTTELDIVYTDPQPEDPCLQNGDLSGEHALPTYRPGQGTWYTVEMNGLGLHDKLNGDAGCGR